MVAEKYLLYLDEEQNIKVRDFQFLEAAIAKDSVIRKVIPKNMVDSDLVMMCSAIYSIKWIIAHIFYYFYTF